MFDVSAICWERVDGNNAVQDQINSPGLTHPPNYYYFSHADGDREACQLACEQEPGCHAYTLLLPEHPNGWADMCYGISESRATRHSTSIAHSGYKVDCGSQTGQIHLYYSTSDLVVHNTIQVISID